MKATTSIDKTASGNKSFLKNKFHLEVNGINKKFNTLKKLLSLKFVNYIKTHTKHGF